jgi:hypothetical protein
VPPGGPPPGAGVPPPGPGEPGAPIVPPSNNTPKIVAVILAVALVAGGVAFALTRGGGSSGGSVDAFCAQAKKIASDPSSNRATVDPAELDKLASAVDQLQKSAPKEIKSDAQVVNEFIKVLVPKLKAAGNDSDKSIKALGDASSAVGAQRLQTAEQNVQKFGEDKCGVDLQLARSSSSDSSTSNFSSSFGTDFSFDSDSFSSVLSSFSSDFGSGFFSSLSSSFNESSTSS